MGTFLILGPCFLALGRFPTEPAVLRSLAFVLISFVFILIAGFMANDLGDLEIDRVVHPERSMISGTAKIPHIRVAFWLCVVLSLLFGALTNFRVLVFLCLQAAWGVAGVRGVEKTR